ncbi:MAG: nicotinamide riboside transporter PnuC [Pseudomonadota bacterium]
MTTETPPYDKLDLAWLAILTVVGGVLSAVLAASIFDLSVFWSGILCVGLIAIGRREGYLVGLYNSFSYSILAYDNGLYGEVYLNLLFFIPTAIVGYFMWQRHTKKGMTVAMRQLAWPQRAFIVFICVACTVGLGLALGLNPNQNTPFIDATTNVLSIAATFLMMWRYKEQWLLYIFLNTVTIAMWFLRFMAGAEAGDLMVLMWSLFLLNAIFGYWRWHIGAKLTGEICERKSTGKAACDAV